MDNSVSRSMLSFTGTDEDADGANYTYRTEGDISQTVHDILGIDLPQLLSLFLEKNRGYGDMADTLGSKAQFVDIHRKVDKLKRGLWEGKDTGGESIEELVRDLFGHILLMHRRLRIEASQRASGGPF